MENNKLSIIQKGILASDKLAVIVASDAPRLRDMPYKDVERDAISVILAYMQQYSPYPESTGLLAIKNFAEQIIAGYSHWVVDDIENFLKWFIENQSNPEVKLVGNKITFLKLSSVLPLYEEQRIDTIRQAKAAAISDERSTPAGHTQVSKDVINEIRERIRPKHVVRELSEDERQEQSTTTTILAEFDALWSKQGTRHGAIKYVTVNDTIIYVYDWERERKFGTLKNYIS